MAGVLAAAGALAAAGSGLEDGREPGRAGGGGKAERGAGETLTVGFAARPRSLDPALAIDRTARIVLSNLMDPLVRLGPSLGPVPSLARSWTQSADGRRITFRLRTDGRWTTGEPVTAADFVWAWKRVLSPELDSPHAHRLFAIAGAARYHHCSPASCARLRGAVGVSARGPDELVVTLGSPQPWFVAQTAHSAFLPVHRATVERFGKRWTAAANIVTNGPFVLAARSREDFTLARNDRWRGAGRVALARVEGRLLPDAQARVQTFDARGVMALDGTGLPAVDMPALAERREYEAYPALGAYAYAFNLSALSDVNQRRAMSLAVDRRAIVELVAQGGQLPATRFAPAAAWPSGAKLAPSPWIPAVGDLPRARAELERAAAVRRRITLLHVDSPGNREIALALRRAWRELGIETVVRARSPSEYLAFRGSLSKDSVHVYQLDWPDVVPEAAGGLALWRCGASRNKSNFCNAGVDRLLERARLAGDPRARSALYAQVEEVLSGPEGAMPGLPLFWPTYPNLEALSIQRSFSVNPLGQIDFSEVDPR